MQDIDVSERTQALAGLMEKHLGARGRTLDACLRRAGRRLPRRLRQQAQVLIEAERMTAHPKLMHRVDGAEVERAYRDIAAHLEAIDLEEERKTRRIRLAAGVAFNLLLVLVLFVVFLWWRGLV